MTFRDFSNALLVALVSIGLIVGALSISLVEFSPQATATATDSLFASPLPLTATSTVPPTLTPTLGLKSPTPSITPTLTNTSLPPTSCQPPSGWGQITIQAGETLDNIAARYSTSKDALRSANCLLLDNLIAGTVLYAPPVVATITSAAATTTTTSMICSQGAPGWVRGYIVKPGDTFFSIATSYYTTASLLKSVNCRNSNLIYTGETLWVPNVVARTASPTSSYATPYPTQLPAITVTPLATEPLTETALPYTLTVEPAEPAAISALMASPTAFPTPK